MSFEPKKRAATEPATSIEPKKPRRAAAGKVKDEEEEEYESVQVTTKLLHKFSVYPEPLRDVVQQSYVDEIYKILDSLNDDRQLSQKFKFHIVRGSRIHGGDPFDYASCQPETFANASMANVAVLEQFLHEAPAKKAGFPKALEAKLANPEFAALHSVNHGQMGWGFDKYECLSLHKTAIIGNKLKHFWIYVERRMVKAVKTEDDDCQIVGDSHAMEQ